MWLIGLELFIIKYFPAEFSLICIKLNEISPKLASLFCLRWFIITTCLHSTDFQTWASQGEKNSETWATFFSGFPPFQCPANLHKCLSFFFPSIQTPMKWKSCFSRRLSYGLKLLAQYEYILINSTFVQIFWNLARMTTSIGTAFLHSRTFAISFTTFNTGSCKTTGLLRCWAVPLLHRQDVLKEFTAS